MQGHGLALMKDASPSEKICAASSSVKIRLIEGGDRLQGEYQTNLGLYALVLFTPRALLDQFGALSPLNESCW